MSTNAPKSVRFFTTPSPNTPSRGGARPHLLEPEGDAAPLPVEPDDLHLERLADLAHVRRVGDLAVTHVGDVHQPVESAQVHEDAVIGDVLHPRLDLVPLPDAVEQDLLPGLPLFLEVDPARHDDVGLLAGKLQHLELPLEVDHGL